MSRLSVPAYSQIRFGAVFHASPFFPLHAITPANCFALGHSPEPFPFHGDITVYFPCEENPAPFLAGAALHRDLADPWPHICPTCHRGYWNSFKDGRFTQTCACGSETLLSLTAMLIGAAVHRDHVGKDS